jgi:phosphoribosylcarboxyaminoimidazole (NCAIR) mutase
MNEQQKEKHKDGAPWDSVRVFSTFNEALLFRNSIAAKDSELQVKIKKYNNNVGESVFVVKKRKDPKLETTLLTKPKNKEKKK